MAEYILGNFLLFTPIIRRIVSPDFFCSTIQLTTRWAYSCDPRPEISYVSLRHLFPHHWFSLYDAFCEKGSRSRVIAVKHVSDGNCVAKNDF